MTIIGKIPGLEKYPRLSRVVFIVIVIGCLALLSFAVSLGTGANDAFPGDMKIRADQQYFSPQISSAKGLRLEITNISVQKLQAGRHTWSADYGYFIRVAPSTSEVTILGNPVYDDNSRDIYWTFAQQNPQQNRTPVKIELNLYPLQGTEKLASSSLYLTWYTNDIVYVNRSFEPSSLTIQATGL